MSRPQKRHLNQDNELVSTRQALLDATLELMNRNKSFDAISLREVTREVGLSPSAFYRHFDDMENLGMELVNHSLLKLRVMLKTLRADAAPNMIIARRSVETLVNYVLTHRRQFQFIFREQYGGLAAIRQAIDEQIKLIIEELASELPTTVGDENWSEADRQMLANLMIGAMTRIAEQAVNLSTENDISQLIEMGKKQLQLVIIGTQYWRSE